MLLAGLEHLALDRKAVTAIATTHRIIDDRMENSTKGRRIGDNLH